MAKTYNMLARVKTWTAFSNSASGDDNSTSNSLEALSDLVQLDVGGHAGHMSDPAVAAFDPIFWLHYANIDRLVSLWEALNPDVWVSQGQSGVGSWTQPRNVPVDASSGMFTTTCTASRILIVVARLDAIQRLGHHLLGFVPDHDHGTGTLCLCPHQNGLS